MTLSISIELATIAPLFVSVLFHFVLAFLRLAFLVAATPHADPIIIVGFDLRLVGFDLGIPYYTRPAPSSDGNGGLRLGIAVASG